VGSGSVTREPSQATYRYGDVVTLTANAAPGWSFAGWSGGVSGSANPVTLTVTGDTAVTATFTQTNGRYQVYLPFVARAAPPPPPMSPPSPWDKVEVWWRVVSPTMWGSYVPFGGTYYQIPRWAVLEFEICSTGEKLVELDHKISLVPSGFGAPGRPESILVSHGPIKLAPWECKVTNPIPHPPLDWGFWGLFVSLRRETEEESRAQFIWVDSPYDKLNPLLVHQGRIRPH